MSAIEVIGQQSRAVQISLGSILLLLVGTGALFASSSFLEFSVFFIIPVAYFTWFIHRKAGAMANAVSAAVTLWANIASPLHVSHPGVAYWNALIWFSFFVSITFIVAALKVLHDRERQLSRVDSLTGIGNRLAFYEFATAERNRALRSHQPITLAYLDLDGFKDINDTLGHQTGDKVLGQRGTNHADERPANGHGSPHGRRRIRADPAGYEQSCCSLVPLTENPLTIALHSCRG